MRTKSYNSMKKETLFCWLLTMIQLIESLRSNTNDSFNDSSEGIRHRETSAT